MATIEEIARAYWKAEESRDIEAITAFFRPDAVWEGPGRRLVGADEIGTYYRDSAAAFPGLEVTVGRVYGSPDDAAIEWSAFMIDHAGGRHALHGANLMTGDGERITGLRAYFNPAELDA
jgi:ketosteroid isomerase-like protein